MAETQNTTNDSDPEGGRYRIEMDNGTGRVVITAGDDWMITRTYDAEGTCTDAQEQRDVADTDTAARKAAYRLATQGYAMDVFDGFGYTIV